MSESAEIVADEEPEAAPAEDIPGHRWLHAGSIYILFDNGNAIGTELRWEEAITDPNGATKTLNLLRTDMDDAFWTATTVLQAQQKN
jgi:hypothetical protein